MVSANDNLPDGARGSLICAAEPANVIVEADLNADVNVTGRVKANVGDSGTPVTLPRAADQRPVYSRERPTFLVTSTRVTDDFGDRVEVRIGEAVILGPLIDSVIETLMAKRANDG